MYVHWKKRSRTQRHRPTGEQTLTAVLVETARIDGKPRQRLICYLGSVGSNRLGMYWHQFDFWKAVAANLDKLGLSDEARLQIESSLEAKVPRPNKAGLAEELKGVEARISGLRGLA